MCKQTLAINHVQYKWGKVNPLARWLLAVQQLTHSLTHTGSLRRRPVCYLHLLCAVAADSTARLPSARAPENVMSAALAAALHIKETAGSRSALPSARRCPFTWKYTAIPVSRGISWDSWGSHHLVCCKIRIRHPVYWLYDAIRAFNWNKMSECMNALGIRWC